MQKAALTAFCVALAVLAPMADAMTIGFAVPGNYAASALGVEGGQWLAVVFRPSGDAGLLEVPTEVTHRNVTSVHTLRIVGEDRSETDINVHEDTTEGVFGPGQIHFSKASPGLAFLYVEAADLQVDGQAVIGEFAVQDEGTSTFRFSRLEDRHGRIRGHEPGGENAVLSMMPGEAASSPLVVRGTMVSYAEWYGLAPSCDSQECPGNGGPWVQEALLPTGHRASTERHSHESLQGPLGSLEVRGELVYLAIGGRSLDASFQGSLRFPLADAPGCPDCVGPDGQTFAATGNITLGGLQPGRGGLQADMEGDVETARFDEQPIDASFLGFRVAGGAAVAVAATAGGYLLLRVLGALFTKLRGETILEQPRRRLVYETIVARPGIGFSDLARETDLSYGVVRHHLDFLLRNDKIVQRQRGPLSHFFENHGKYDRTWPQVAALRDEGLRHLHDWLAANPERTQQDVVAAMATNGWSRSATRRALARLVATKLAVESPAGRFKKYRTA